MFTPFKFIPGASEERGNADHGWLKTFHTFDFASYQGSGHDHLGPLVINEDRVAPRTGFDTHSHREFEIRHKDSMGNTEILKRGDVQLTSAGTGISHSEETHEDKQVHFLQILSIPSLSKFVPKYFTGYFTEQDKTNKFVEVVASITSSSVSPARERTGPAPFQSPLTLSAALMSSSTLTHTDTLKGYIQTIQTSGYRDLSVHKYHMWK